MRPVRITLSLPAADDDAIATAQSRSTAGNFTFDGALVTGGVAVFGSTAQQVVFSSTANETGKTYRVTGTVIYHGNVVNTVTETVIAAATSGGTTRFFFNVTNIAADGATAGAVRWGTSTIGATVPVVPDYNQNPFDLAFTVVATNTPSWTLQYTFDDLFNLSADPTWQSDTAFTTKATTLNGNFIAPCTGIRLKNTTAGTAGSCVLTVIQAGPLP
jgi:hypothetical protein